LTWPYGCGKKIATTAVARKLITRACHLLTDAAGPVEAPDSSAGECVLPRPRRALVCNEISCIVTK
jgi:hypothetical protein